MLIPFKECVRVSGLPLYNILQVGANLGAQGPRFVEAGAKTIVWFESDKSSEMALYEATKLLRARQGYFYETLGNGTQSTMRFDSFYRKNMAFIDLEQVDFVGVETSGTELAVLEGFGSLLSNYKNIKAIYCRVNLEENPCAIDQLLGSSGFSRFLTRTADSGLSEALYIRG